MSQAEHHAAHYIGPRQGKIAALAVTTSSEAHLLSTVLSENPVGRFITLSVGAASYIAFADTGANAIDEATVDTAGSTAQCVLIPANTLVRLVPTGAYLIVKGSGATTLRIWVSGP